MATPADNITNTDKPQLNLTVKVVASMLVALALAAIFVILGVCIGITVGVEAYRDGWSKGASGHNSSAQVGFSSLDGDAVCVNGIAYAPYRGDTYPDWQGVYRPIEQGQPALTGEDGQEVQQRKIPVRCTIQRG